MRSDSGDTPPPRSLQQKVRYFFNKPGGKGCGNEPWRRPPVMPRQGGWGCPIESSHSIPPLSSYCKEFLRQSFGFSQKFSSFPAGLRRKKPPSSSPGDSGFLLRTAPPASPPAVSIESAGTWPAAYCHPIKACFDGAPLDFIRPGVNPARINALPRKAFAAQAPSRPTAGPCGQSAYCNFSASELIHSASGKYRIGRNMAGSILPTLIRSLPRPSILMAMPMISAPPTAVISVITAWGR